MKTILLPLVLAATVLATPLIAATIHVPGDQPTIQAGINAAVDGDTVLLADGTYTGPGNRGLLITRSIILRSDNGPTTCIIDCEQEDHGINIANTEPGSIVVEGLTVRDGSSSGIICQGPSNPVIRNCVVQSCQGGGIHFSQNCSGRVEGCLISGNQASNGTGGIRVGYGSHVEVFDNVISGNSGMVGGIDYPAGSSGTVVGNILEGNTAGWGGGLFCLEAVVDLRNNLFLNNTAEVVGGGLYWQGDDSSPAWSVESCTFSGNEAPLGGGAYLVKSSRMPKTATGSPGIVITMTDCIFHEDIANEGPEIYAAGSVGGIHLELDYSNLVGGADSVTATGACTVFWGPGMIDEDPLFVSGPMGNHCLAQTVSGQPMDSPCVDTGDPAGHPPAGTTRTDGVQDFGVPDMGFHYPVPSTVDAEINCVPESGTLPFVSRFTVTLHNRFTGQTRRIAGRIDVRTAGNQVITGWRQGYTTIPPDESFTTFWGQLIPAIPSLVGSNLFRLRVEDVTPAPFNQPPYPASGDSTEDDCRIIAAWRL